MEDKFYKIVNDSIYYSNQDTTIIVPVKWYEETPSRPVQCGIIGLWFTGLLITLLIFKK